MPACFGHVNIAKENTERPLGKLIEQRGEQPLL